MNNYLLQETDYLFDNVGLFDDDMRRLTGMTLVEFQQKASKPTLSEDGLLLTWAVDDYTLHWCHIDKCYKLSRRSSS